MSATYVENGKVFPGSDIREWAEVRLAEIAELRRHRVSSAPQEWWDIKDAPWEGKLLLYAPPENLHTDPVGKLGEIRVSRRADYCWATKWMPLPEPPQ